MLGTDSSRVKLNKIDILALFGLLRALHLQELKEHCETRSKSYGRGIRSGMQALEVGRHLKWRLEVRGRAWMAHSKLERRRQEFEVWGDGCSKWECKCSKWAGGRSNGRSRVRSGRGGRGRAFEVGGLTGVRSGLGGDSSAVTWQDVGEDREPARGEGVRSPFEEVVGVNDDGMSTAFDRPDPRPNTKTPTRPKRKVELRGRKGLDIQVTLI
ncbi:hypothetical protein B0H14DRAFT_2589491 [Mycena olivaceomarginata]|nr:hypothetical protein B0H14DRAFT_2589491 [Mycena olivaceomarginata]